MKKYLLERNLSIQEIFEHFASMMSFSHPAIDRIVENYLTLKKEGIVSKLEEKYTENLYDVIGVENPLFGENDVSIKD